MAYEVTANRKRPQGFDQLVGQEFVVSTLQSSLEQGRIAHAYLFSGPRGVGKTSAARILAKALNCEKGPAAQPCGECTTCQEIARGSSLDVIEIDGASNTSVNDVREIRDEVLFAPNSSRYKVYIIDEVHMLSNSAFNALLKTIEEPPPYVVFIFATTEIHRVPATIRSRCQQFNFRLHSIEGIKACLAAVCQEAQIPAEDEALLWISKEATGSLRDAYTLLDQVISFADGGITLAQIRDKLGIVGLEQINSLAIAFVNEDTQQALELLEEALNQGIPAEQFVIDLVEYFRSLLFLQHDLGKESLLGYSPDSFSPEAVEGLESAQVERAIEILLELYRNLRFSLNQRFELELVVARLSHIGRYIPNRDILEQIRKIRAGIVSGAPTTDMPAAPDTTPPQRPGGVEAGLRETRKKSVEPVVAPSTSVDTSVLADGPKDVPEGDPCRRVVEAVRRKKLALASAMDKAHTMTLEGGIFRLVYQKGDRYSGEKVTSDRRAVEQVAAEVLGKSAQLEVAYVDVVEDDTAVDPPALDETVEIVKRVFKGQVVEGE